MLKVHRLRFLSIFGIGYVIQKLRFFREFYSVCGDVGGTPRIIKKMTDFWENLLNSRQCQNYIDKGFYVS